MYTCSGYTKTYFSPPSPRLPFPNLPSRLLPFHLSYPIPAFSHPTLPALPNPLQPLPYHPIPTLSHLSLAIPSPLPPLSLSLSRSSTSAVTKSSTQKSDAPLDPKMMFVVRTNDDSVGDRGGGLMVGWGF